MAKFILFKNYENFQFMPFDIFDKIKTAEDGLAFMNREFPDSVPIFGETEILAQFGPGTLPALPMVSIKCSPHSTQVTHS